MMLTLFSFFLNSLCDLSLHYRYVYACVRERACTPALTSLIFADFILLIYINNKITGYEYMNPHRNYRLNHLLSSAFLSNLGIIFKMSPHSEGVLFNPSCSSVRPVRQKQYGGGWV